MWEKFVKVWKNFGNLIKILKDLKKILIKILKNLTFWNFFIIDFYSLSSKKFVYGGRFPGSPHGAATDNAARYTVTSSPVPSTERNISLDFNYVFYDFVSRKSRKIQLYE